MRSAALHFLPCLALCVVPAACTPDTASVPCNGSPFLCGRTYNQVAFPGTHDSFSTREDSFGAPDQTHVVSWQLTQGIRVLHLETFLFNGGDYVCHGLCEIGSKPVVDALTLVRTFLDANPREVVTLLIETTGLVPANIIADVTQAGLIPYVHPQAPGAPWPTLGELINRGERLVVFTDADNLPAPWYLDRWHSTWETPWETYEPGDFSCKLDRGTAGAPIYTVDEFLDNPIVDPIPRPERAALVNVNPFFIDRLEGCHRLSAQLPNIVLVNYSEVGDVLSAIAMLNGLAPEPDSGVDLDAGQLPLSDADTTSPMDARSSMTQDASMDATMDASRHTSDLFDASPE